MIAEAGIVDLSDPDTFVRQEHHAAFAHLRENCPVYWSDLPDGGGFWSLTRYDDVLAAYRDHDTFSSERGAVLGGSFRSQDDTAAGRMLVASDPPRHRMIRQAMHPAFAATMVARVGRQVRSLLEAALDRLVVDGGGDFATDVAPEMPAAALMVLMNIGHDEAHQLIRLTRQMIGFRDPRYHQGIEPERLRLALFQSEIFEFFSDLVAARRRSPGEDVVSMLLGSEINGRPMSEEDVLYNCMNVAVGGDETTSYTACSGVLALMDNGSEYERLLREPGLRDSAIDEFLRWASTNAYVQRAAKKDIQVGDALIRQGDSVALWNVSANRDEKYFSRPDQFDLGRSPNRHLSFGSGTHRCAGAALGKIELEVLLDLLVERQVQLEPSDPVEYLRSNFILGINRLPVQTVRPRGTDR